MKVGFFTVLDTDPSHYLHACALVRGVKARMPGAEVVQLTDERTPEVLGVDGVRREAADPALLRLRLRHYAACEGEWLLADTDVSVRADVRGIFDDPHFDVALCDRDWPHLPQGEQLLREMPFNTGVVFSRSSRFWRDVLEAWESYGPAMQDWMSEQRAVWQVVRTGRYRVRILPGMLYNYPPQAPRDAPPVSALLHFKGPRKAWLSKLAYEELSRP